MLFAGEAGSGSQVLSPRVARSRSLAQLPFVLGGCDGRERGLREASERKVVKGTFLFAFYTRDLALVRRGRSLRAGTIAKHVRSVQVIYTHESHAPVRDVSSRRVPLRSPPPWPPRVPAPGARTEKTCRAAQIIRPFDTPPRTPAPAQLHPNELRPPGGPKEYSLGCVHYAGR